MRADTSCRFNEAKYKILKTLSETPRFFAREIAEFTGLSGGYENKAEQNSLLGVHLAAQRDVGGKKVGMCTGT